MLKIAYCDDQSHDREAIDKALVHIQNTWKEDFFIASYNSGEELCENLNTASYDVLLLDILMNGMCGIETARKIRAMGIESVLVFISSYDDDVKKLFQFGTTAFLDKPIHIHELMEVLLKVKQEKGKKESMDVFEYKKHGQTNRVKLHEIIYIEARRNQIFIHKSNHSLEFTGTLKEVWSHLSHYPQFVKPHKSYIFNFSYAALHSSTIVLNTSETFNVGKKYKADTEMRFLTYMRKRSE